jgi:hypothetical protein
MSFIYTLANATFWSWVLDRYKVNPDVDHSLITELLPDTVSMHPVLLRPSGDKGPSGRLRNELLLDLCDGPAEHDGGG